MPVDPRVLEAVRPYFSQPVGSAFNIDFQFLMIPHPYDYYTKTQLKVDMKFAASQKAVAEAMAMRRH